MTKTKNENMEQVVYICVRNGFSDTYFFFLIFDILSEESAFLVTLLILRGLVVQTRKIYKLRSSMVMIIADYCLYHSWSCTFEQ